VFSTAILSLVRAEHSRQGNCKLNSRYWNSAVLASRRFLAGAYSFSHRGVHWPRAAFYCGRRRCILPSQRTFSPYRPPPPPPRCASRRTFPFGGICSSPASTRCSVIIETTCVGTRETRVKDDNEGDADFFYFVWNRFIFLFYKRKMKISSW